MRKTVVVGKLDDLENRMMLIGALMTAAQQMLIDLLDELSLTNEVNREQEETISEVENREFQESVHRERKKTSARKKPKSAKKPIIIQPSVAASDVA